MAGFMIENSTLKSRRDQDMSTPLLPAPEGHSDEGRSSEDRARNPKHGGSIRPVAVNLSGSSIFVNALGNNNTIHITVTDGGKTDQGSEPQPEPAHEKTRDAQTVDAEVVHETGPEREDAGARTEGQTRPRADATGEQNDATAGAGAQDEAGTGGQDTTEEQPEATAPQEDRSRFSSMWKKVAGLAGAALLGTVLYSTFSGDTKPSKTTASTDPEKTAAAATVKDKAPEREPPPFKSYVKVVMRPETPLPTDRKERKELAKLMFAFRHQSEDGKTIDANAETCAEPWIFKDGRGRDMVCIPLQYLESLETKIKREFFFKGAANFKGTGAVPTHGRFHDGTQILVPRSLLYDEIFWDKLELALPEIRENARYHLDYAAYVNVRRNATYAMHRIDDFGEGTPKYEYKIYPGVRTLGEIATEIPEANFGS